MGKSLLPTGFVRPLSQNRRRGRRHLLGIPATVSGESGELPVKIIEFSKHGLGLHTTKPLTPGEVYHVRAFDTLIPAGLRVRIVSVRNVADDSFIIGSEVV